MITFYIYSNSISKKKIHQEFFYSHIPSAYISWNSIKKALFSSTVWLLLALLEYTEALIISTHVKTLLTESFTPLSSLKITLGSNVRILSSLPLSTLCLTYIAVCICSHRKNPFTSVPYIFKLLFKTWDLVYHCCVAYDYSRKVGYRLLQPSNLTGLLWETCREYPFLYHLFLIQKQYRENALNYSTL